ncbi:MAG: ATP-binding cassette domain-containing protein [Chloroflexi bacterium]|nr:ATP-binding cassette domain-containing protein [Chloroflexota bacterium]
MAIETSALTKCYEKNDILAVDRLELSVEAGTIYALLGPNGAGKTTTLSMLTTLVPPTSGSARVAGADIVREPHVVRSRIGVTFQEIVLDKDLKGREVLDYHGQLYGMPRRKRHDRIDTLLDLVELNDAADRLVKTYSGGMKRRLELARGLMTDPQVLFLDEPTQGLDPQNRASVWSYLRQLQADRGMTIMLTTHYMEEAEALADRVGIIDQGRLVVEGAPTELTAALGADVIHITGQGDAEKLAGSLRALPFVQSVETVSGMIQVGVEAGSRSLPQVVEAAAGQNFAIEDISVAQPSLGDVFLKHTGYALRDV